MVCCIILTIRQYRTRLLCAFCNLFVMGTAGSKICACAVAFGVNRDGREFPGRWLAIHRFCRFWVTNLPQHWFRQAKVCLAFMMAYLLRYLYHCIDMYEGYHGWLDYQKKAPWDREWPSMRINYRLDHKQNNSWSAKPSRAESTS